MQGAVFGALPRWGNTVSDEINETQSTERARVECDEKCGAFVEPITIEEYRAALEHWMDHPLHYGCSHGA